MKNQFHHVGLTVGDIEKSVEFYKLLGFTRDGDKPFAVKDRWIKTMTGFPDAHLLIQNLVLGNGTILELLQYVAPKGTNSGPIPTCNTGSAHVAVAVDDIDAEYKRLSSAGVRFRSEPITVSAEAAEGVRACYGIDPDGYTFEILQLVR